MKLADSEIYPSNTIVSGFFSELFDYAHYFAAYTPTQKAVNGFSHEDSTHLQIWRNLCEALDSRETNLAQIRLKLQLQIDQAQTQLNAVQLLIQAEQQLMVVNPNQANIANVKQSIKLTDL